MVVYGEGGYSCPEHGAIRPGPRSRDALEAGDFEPACPRCGAALITRAVDEDQPLDPRNVYAATKLHQEHLGQAFAAATGSDVVSLRYHNVYGPRMPRDTPYAGVASIVRSACEAGRAPRVFEDGAQRRDFIHVADVALANRLALTAPDPVSGSYNVATGRSTTILEMATHVCSGMGAGTIEPGRDRRVPDRRRAPHQRITRTRPSRAGLHGPDPPRRRPAAVRDSTHAGLPDGLGSGSGQSAQCRQSRSWAARTAASNRTVRNRSVFRANSAITSATVTPSPVAAPASTSVTSARVA